MPSKSIVVGFDSDDATKRAVVFAADFAVKHDATVRLVHVIDWSPFELNTSDGYAARAAEIQQEVRADREKLFPPIVNAFTAEGVEVETVTRTGNPVDELIAEAEACEALVIVVGRRGGSKVKRMLLGSVARGLVNLAHGPVVVVP